MERVSQDNPGYSRRLSRVRERQAVRRRRQSPRSTWLAELYIMFSVRSLSSSSSVICEQSCALSMTIETCFALTFERDANYRACIYRFGV